MEQAKKHIWLAAGGGFVLGVAITVLAFSLISCPQKQHRLGHKRPGIERLAQEKRADMRQDKHKGQFDKRKLDQKKLDKERGGKPFDEGMKGKQNQGPDMRRNRHADGDMKERFADKLKLTEEQKAKIEAYRQEDMAKVEPLFKQMDELRAQADQLREENRARFESVLTDEQKEILQQMKQDFKNKHPQGDLKGAKDGDLKGKPQKPTDGKRFDAKRAIDAAPEKLPAEEANNAAGGEVLSK